MKRLHYLIFAFCLLLSFNLFAETKIIRGVMSKGIKNREPVGESKIFSASADKIYCFTEISSDVIPTNIVHLWLYNNNIMAEIPLSVNANNWRTYSSKIISPSWAGSWKVEIYSEKGKLISSIPFEVTDAK